MIRLLPEMPALLGDVYAPVMPRWLTNLLRLLFIGFAVITAWFSAHDWADMPVLFKVLVCILIPVFLFGALHPRGWAQLSVVPFFMADHLGMYFPHNYGLVDAIGKNAEDLNRQFKQWLFVPWENISNVRAEYLDIGQDGKTLCAVFDIQAFSPEFESYFVSKRWVDKQTGSDAVAFYCNMPPSPRKVIQVLQEMMDEYKKSRLRAKYVRAN